ncbi:hypothetical protein [Actinoplanes sp. NPDC051851]|uniref:hypothetical protein n=1 Tax=Actinoplanes sp. NPDC051851 TaxID=3154753 RepID=UPI00342650B1
MKKALLPFIAVGAVLLLFVAGLVLLQPAQAQAVDAGDCLTPEGDPWTLDSQQRQNAQLIIDIGKQRHIPARGWAIAIATAAQESSLHGDPTPDAYGSSGLFQQTPPWWGTREQVNDPTYASNAFYTALLKVSGWGIMPLTVAAQTVQNSAYPDYYRKHTATAINAVRDLGGVELDCSKITTGGSVQPVARNPDGSWPTEGCTVRPDPTTGSGCLTPRTWNMVQVAEAAGYPKPGCYRVDNHGEHPKGRACDFMMTSGGEASGAQKTRGDQMAVWAVTNADNLGIMYVIWFRRIWTREKGWHAYNNPFGGNDPSGWHTNHVHISVY